MPDEQSVAIPVRNIWLLQLLASEFSLKSTRTASAREVLPEELEQEIPALVSEILVEEVSARLTTGLTTGFNRNSRVLSRVRGKIDVGTTYSHGLMERGQIRCTFDEIDRDIPSNRLILASLRRARKLPKTDSRCLRLADELSAMGISDVAPSRQQRREFHSRRHLFRDRTMITAAELLLDLMLPDANDGDRMIISPRGDQKYMRLLFEKAVFGYYRRYLKPQGWEVNRGTNLGWHADEMTGDAARLLPKMELDIVLRRPGFPTHIIDTKFKNIVAANRFKNSKYASENLYQIYTYVRTQDEHWDLGEETIATLLYPVVGGYSHGTFELGKHLFQMATVDLAANYETLSHQLDAVANPVRSRIEKGAYKKLSEQTSLF